MSEQGPSTAVAAARLAYDEGQTQCIDWDCDQAYLDQGAHPDGYWRCHFCGPCVRVDAKSRPTEADHA
jgi:succinate dehydrogenase/fumarate reductase-like Fe-S protein